MPEFKVGDKVRVVVSHRNGRINTVPGTEGKHSNYYVGETGVVSYVGRGLTVNVFFPPTAMWPDRGDYFVNKEELELVNPHVVGLMLE